MPVRPVGGRTPSGGSDAGGIARFPAPTAPVARGAGVLPYPSALPMSTRLPTIDSVRAREVR